jgi:hypothetical protein
MGRHAEYTDEQLKEKLNSIVVKYGSLSVESLKKASEEDAEQFPSYKMFERRFGGIKTIKRMMSSRAENVEKIADKVLTKQE